MDSRKLELIQLLEKAECLKLGEFTLKSGKKSNYYVDLRQVTVEPFRLIVDLVKEEVESICKVRNKPVALTGVPYGVVPVAGAVAYASSLQYYPVRKETKDYGNNQDMNLQGHEFILIEDVMSSGGSIIETIQKMSDKKVIAVIVVVDRESGGQEKLNDSYPDVEVRSLLKASEILDKLNKRV